MKYLMGHIKQAAFLATLLLSATVTHADNSSDAQLKQLQQSYQNATFIAADFRQEKQVKFISKPLVSQGKFQFANNVGLNWLIEQPFFSRTLFLPKGVFKVSKSGQISEEKDRATLAIADLLQSLFSGQWQSLADKFNVGQSQPLDENRWQITLTATDQWVSKAVKSITLQGKQDLQQIERIILLDAKGNTTIISLAKIQQQTAPLNDEQRQRFVVD